MAKTGLAETYQGVEEARVLFQEAKLELPPIPESLAPDFVRRRDWCFASCPMPQSPYNFFGWVTAAVKGSPEDFVLLSHDGHGINSYALHFYLVLHPLMLFLQVAWGGAYMDKEETTAEVNRCFRLCHEIVSAVGPAVDEGAAIGGRDSILITASNLTCSCTYPPLSLKMTGSLSARISMSDCSPEFALRETLKWIQLQLA
jgi:hypothetical protein